MSDIHSQPASDAYRDNWERIFAPKRKVTVYEALEYCGIPVQINDSIPRGEIWLMSEKRIDRITNIGAPQNG